MTIKTILAPIRGDGKGEGVLNHALAVARRFDAHIDVIHARARPQDMLPYATIMLTEKMSHDIIESAEASAAAAEANLRKLFDDYCAANGVKLVEAPAPDGDGVTASFREETGKQAAIVAVRGRLADLIVVPRPDGDTQLGANTLESALLETGKPVLMAPDLPLDGIGDTIVVAWNGSAEAARAVDAAMPLLANAGAVNILIGSDAESTELPAEDLMRYMGWHGVEAEIHVFAAGTFDIGEPLMAEAAARNADLLVMGGYGHSRRRELVMAASPATSSRKPTSRC